MKNESINFLTFDIEEWFRANYNYVKIPNKIEDINLESNVDRLIEICDKYNVKSTCYVLGDVAKRNLRIVKKLFDNGHEIASHGNAHKQVCSMSQKEFKEDLHSSTCILEQIIGEKVVGFRAPSWSIKKENIEWFYETLKEEGYVYSSSVYPAKHKLFGIEGFTKTPHYPTDHNILEIPQSLTNIFGFQCGYAGGAFLRLFPHWFIERSIKRSNDKNEPVFLYLHPREIDATGERLSLNMVDSFFHYYNVGTRCEQKFCDLVQKYANSFMKMSDFAARYHHVL